MRAIPASVLGKLQRLPPLSPTAARLFCLGDGDGDLRKIAACVSADPALTGHVLRLVNSPLFGIRQQVTSVLQAIALVGCHRLRALVTTAALRMLLTPGLDSPSLKQCWRHSVACACIALEIAGSTSIERNTAYTAGLLHDIGCFAMLSCWPKEYAQLLGAAAGADLLRLERSQLGVDHPEAGAFLLEHWGLPSELVEAARHHHGAGSERAVGLVELVSSACRIADDIGFAMSAAADHAESAPALAAWPVRHPEEFSFRIADCINQLEHF